MYVINKDATFKSLDKNDKTVYFTKHEYDLVTTSEDHENGCLMFSFLIDPQQKRYRVDYSMVSLKRMEVTV